MFSFIFISFTEAYFTLNETNLHETNIFILTLSSYVRYGSKTKEQNIKML